MDSLIIEPTLNSPKVVLDPKEGVFTFSGESRPENVRSFFLPILEWLDAFVAEAQSPCRFDFCFDYFNSTSAKYILDVFKALRKIHDGGNEVLVRWHYEEDDEDMLEVGQEMSRMSGLTFEYIQDEI
jgi:hypothetical protein